MISTEEQMSMSRNVLDALHDAVANRNLEAAIDCFEPDGLFILESARALKVNEINEGNATSSIWKIEPHPRSTKIAVEQPCGSTLVAKFEEHFKSEGSVTAKGIGCLSINGKGCDCKISQYQLIFLACSDICETSQASTTNSSLTAMKHEVPSLINYSRSHVSNHLIQNRNDSTRTSENVGENDLEQSSSVNDEFTDQEDFSESVAPQETMPGAYTSAERAVGQLPAWARRFQSRRGRTNRNLRWSSQYRSRNLLWSSQHPSSGMSNMGPVSAILVDSAEIEETVRNRIICNAANAEVLEDGPPLQKKRQILLIGTIIIFAGGMGLGLIIGLLQIGKRNSGEQKPTTSPSMSPTVFSVPTIQSIIEKDVVRCGIIDELGFGKLDQKTGGSEGFGVDLCRAIAATVLDDPTKVDPIPVSNEDRFFVLANKTVDVLSRKDTFTMERDIKEPSTGAGFSFSTPFLYDGLGFAGDQKFVHCADQFKTLNECGNLKVCVLKATTHSDIISNQLPASHLFFVDTIESQFESLSNGLCNVIAGEQSSISKAAAQKIGHSGDYTIGENRLSREPLALVTRDDDPHWTSVVNDVVEILLLAEEQGVTQKSILANGGSSSNIYTRFRRAIEAVGNYGEIYERHLQPIYPRKGLNLLYNSHHNRSTGLLYSFPFGNTQKYGPKPQNNGTIQKILSKGKLLCGVVPRVGFAHFNILFQRWNGLDIDYCRALSLSIFKQHNLNSKFEIIQLPHNKSNEHFTSLLNESIDILLGGSYRLEENIRQPSFEDGFAFSVPYYYNNHDSNSTISAGAYHYTSMYDSLSLVTRNDDPQWSAFVNWIVVSTFYAEEKGINQSTANNMPMVNLFGEQFARMFRDTITFIGNYQEIYTRNLEKYIPRAGRNLLNKNPFGPQHQSRLSTLDLNHDGD